MAELTDEPIPQEIRDSLGGFSLLLAGANVIMQLARLPVGHGVAKSTVDSGRADKHPFKRLRTTSAYLAISMLGTADERIRLRGEVARSHAQVRSKPGDDVQYRAFDSELQRWVAACLYFGAVDVFTRLYGTPTPDQHARLLRHGRRFGTTLQMREDQWFSTHEEFDAYWQAGIAEIRMDDLTRTHLRSIAAEGVLFAPLAARGGAAARIGGVLERAAAPGATFRTLGFLPEPFREELGLPWSAAQQRRHDAIFERVADVVARTPHLVRDFPLNLYLWDTRRRWRTGQPVI
ncbi:MAG: oxygenase MpaB family protein [Baekduiaceae bacterium]